MRKAILSLFLIIIFFNPGAAAENYLLHIVLQYEKEKEEIFNLMVNNGSLLSINYEHSIFQTLQKEIYLIQNGSMKLQEIAFGNLEAASYYNPSPNNIYRQGSLWKISFTNSPSYQKLKIRIPYAVQFFLELNQAIIWTPRDKDRGALLIVNIESQKYQERYEKNFR